MDADQAGIYYLLIVILAFAISLYYRKKNKKNTNSPYTVSEAVTEDDSCSSTEEETAADTLKTGGCQAFDRYSFNLLCYWIFQKIDRQNHVDFSGIKEKLLGVFDGKLPEILEDNTTHLAADSKEFLQEMLGKIEYSPSLKYWFFTRSRTILFWLKYISGLAGVVFVVLFEIGIRREDDNYCFIFFIAAALCFILSYFCSHFSDRLFTQMLSKLKPGDYLKLLSEPDEVIEEERKINQLSRNETVFNKQKVQLSKKKIICGHLLQHSNELPDTISNKMCLYLVMDYLRTNFSSEGDSCLLQMEMEVFEYIYAFNSKSVYACYTLAMLYYDVQRYDDFHETLVKCRVINGYDCYIEGLIKAWDFYQDNYHPAVPED